MRIVIIALATVFAALPALAHEPRKGPNGGTLVDAGRYHVELVIKDPSVDVFLTDDADKPVPSTGFKAVAIFVAAGKSQRILLEPTDGNRLSAQAHVSIPANPKGAVQLTAPDGKTAQGRFN
jgi:hypothetical protein